MTKKIKRLFRRGNTGTGNLKSRLKATAYIIDIVSVNRLIVNNCNHLPLQALFEGGALYA